MPYIFFHDRSNIYEVVTYACAVEMAKVIHIMQDALLVDMLVHVRVVRVFKDELSCSICFFVDFCLQPSLPVFLSNGIQGSSSP